jgi:hypothetical protein
LVTAAVDGVFEYELSPVVGVAPASVVKGASPGHPRTLEAHLQSLPVDLVGVLAPIVGCALLGAELLAGYLIALWGVARLTLITFGRLRSHSDEATLVNAAPS